VTAWVALFLRFIAVWCGWQIFCGILDLYSALQLLHRTPGSLPVLGSWSGEAINHLSRKYTQTPGQVSTDIYSHIGFSIFIHLFWAVILWTGCRHIAGMFTDGLDPAIRK